MTVEDEPKVDKVSGESRQSGSPSGNSNGHGHGPRPFHVYQPFAFLNPTRAHYVLHSVDGGSHSTQSSDRKRTGAIDVGSDSLGAHDQPFFKWRSRDNRKGRHTLVVPKGSGSSVATPPITTKPREVLRGILRMFTTFPINDISYLVAILVTLGSIVWCINGFFVFLPIIRPETEFKNEVQIGGSATAFVGATIFEVGAVLMMIEALRAEKKMCVGWEVKESESDKLEEEAKKLIVGECKHHHAGKGLLGPSGFPTESSTHWLPLTHSIPTYHQKHHHLHTIASISSLIQLFGATIFYISGISGLVINVSDPNASQNLLDGVFWAPQVIGGTGFVISGWLFMIESQQVWWAISLKDLKTLGWHVGFWNLIGGIGFTLSGAFGFSTSSGAVFQSACTTFWGSWAFLIGSVAQWYETLEKYPVEKQ